MCFWGGQATNFEMPLKIGCWGKEILFQTDVGVRKDVREERSQDFLTTIELIGKPVENCHLPLLTLSPGPRKDFPFLFDVGSGMS